LKNSIMYSKTRMIGELNECLFKLREPLANFLIRVIQPMFNNNNWEKNIFIELEKNSNYKKIIKQNNMKSLNDLDISLLLNIFLDNFSNLKNYYNTLQKKEHYQYFGKFNDNYLTKSIIEHRRIIAHPNGKNINIEIMKSIIDDFIDFGKYIDIEKDVLRSIEVLKSKYSKYQHNTEEEKTKIERIIFIENKVIRNALNNEMLDDDIKDSILTTLFRLKTKKTSKEIDEFFIGAQKTSSRGKEIRDALRALKLDAFEDIRKEYESLFIRNIDSK